MRPLEFWTRELVPAHDNTIQFMQLYSLQTTIGIRYEYPDASSASKQHDSSRTCSLPLLTNTRSVVRDVANTCAGVLHQSLLGHEHQVVIKLA